MGKSQKNKLTLEAVSLSSSEMAQILTNHLNDTFHHLIVNEGKHYELQAKSYENGVKVTPYYEDNLLLSPNITGSIFIECQDGAYRVTATPDDHPMTVIRNPIGTIECVGNRHLDQFEVVLDSKKAVRKFCVAFFKDCLNESENAESHPEGYSDMVPLESWGKGRMYKILAKKVAKDTQDPSQA